MLGLQPGVPGCCAAEQSRTVQESEVTKFHGMQRVLRMLCDALVAPPAALCGLTIIPVFVKLVIEDEVPLCRPSVLWPVAVGAVLACRAMMERQKAEAACDDTGWKLSTASSAKHDVASSCPTPTCWR
jgi:hypothetical protein